MQGFLVGFFSAKGFNFLHQGFGLADDVCKPDFGAIGELVGYDIFGYEAGCVGCGAVDFGGVFAGVYSPAHTRMTTIRVNYDFASGQAGVSSRASVVPDAGTIDDQLFLGYRETVFLEYWSDDFFIDIEGYLFEWN